MPSVERETNDCAAVPSAKFCFRWARSEAGRSTHLVEGICAAGVYPVENLAGAIWRRAGVGDDLLDFVEGHIAEIGA